MKHLLKDLLALASVCVTLGSPALAAGVPAPLPTDPNFASGCGPTCIPTPFLPVGTLVYAGVAYYGNAFLGCDVDRPVNQQLQWVDRDLWYYYTPAHVCAPGR